MADKTVSGTGTGDVKAEKAAKPTTKAPTEDKGMRIMNIPLRTEWIKVPRTKRSKRALGTIREFVSRHMKSYDVKISQKVNEKVWIRGIHKPPAKIRVKVSTDKDGVVRVMLPEEIFREAKKGKEKGRFKQVKETLEKEKGLPGMGGPKEEILKRGKKKTKIKSGEKKTEKKETETEKKETKTERKTETKEKTKDEKE